MSYRKGTGSAEDITFAYDDRGGIIDHPRGKSKTGGIAYVSASANSIAAPAAPPAAAAPSGSFFASSSETAEIT